jgi:hypothetical protein
MAENPTGSAGGTGGGASSAPDGETEGATVGKVGDPNQAIQKAGDAGKTALDAVKPKGAPDTGAKGDTAPGGSSVDVDEEDAPALGAGGTSEAANGDDDTADVKRGPSTQTKAAAAAAAVPVAGAAGQLIVLMMFLNWLKGLLMNLLALLGNLWNLLIGLALAIGKAVLGAVMGFGAGVSAAVGGAISATAAGVVSFAAGGMVAVLVVVTIVASVASGDNLAQKDTVQQQCSVTAQTALDKVTGSDGDVDAATLSNAQTIYSVLKGWGMPDENIAGIIGNWDAESGIDPTSVQGDFNTPQAISAAKQTEATNTNNGIGLGQWTFGRNSALRTYATGHGLNWWNLATQLGFMVSSSEGGNADIVKTMITTSQGTPADAAYYFHDNWERSADTDAMKARRATYAEKWMGLFTGWSADQTLADSILAQAVTTVTGADTARAASIRSDCRSASTAAVTTKAGGLTLDEATQLIALYKQEGEQFLDTKYGAGGPGDCGYGKADNCVGFDTYFMNKYTTFDKYAPGNGIDQAASIASMTGKTTSKTPTVYSIASGPGTGAAGHVMVILGIQGDQAIIGEAACGTDGAGTRAYTRSVASITNSDWTFTDVSDLVAAKNSLSS